MKPQAIAGVSAGSEREIETVYPSIAADPIGRAIGSICDLIPLRIGGIKLSALLFALPLAPFALFGYFLLKVAGRKFILTNRALRIRGALSDRLIREVPLGEINNIAVEVLGGQSFYHAGNLILLKAGGDELVTLEGIGRPHRFRQIILDAREARLQNDASLATIDARHPQPA